MTDQKWVYTFQQVEEVEKHVGGVWEKVRGLLGGKGANLADMTRIGVPVPPGFTVTTEACNAYIDGGEKFPGGPIRDSCYQPCEQGCKEDSDGEY